MAEYPTENINPRIAEAQAALREYDEGEATTQRAHRILIPVENRLRKDSINGDPAVTNLRTQIEERFSAFDRPTSA
tara:strand:- start:4 stop:231 length:228 start_codon:yes stop_codon:yes gene_type:complete